MIDIMLNDMFENWFHLKQRRNNRIRDIRGPVHKNMWFKLHINKTKRK